MNDATAVLTLLAFYTTILAVAMIIGITVVGGIAFWKTEKGAAKTFSMILVRANALHMLTVILIVGAAVALRIIDAINSEAIVGILSGVAGYVLGGATKDIKPKDDEIQELPQSK